MGLGGLLLFGDSHSRSFAGPIPQMCHCRLFPCLLGQVVDQVKLSSVLHDHLGEWHFGGLLVWSVDVGVMCPLVFWQPLLR